MVPPDIDGRPPPPPPTLHPPASSVGTQPSTVSDPTLSTAYSSISTAGPTRPAPPGLQLGPGPFIGTASTGVTHSGFSYMAPPAPSATLGGWNQPALSHSFGQQLPWSAFPMVSVTFIINMHRPNLWVWGGCLVWDCNYFDLNACTVYYLRV